MADLAQIGVQLRLLLDKLGPDIKRAGAMIKTQLGNLPFVSPSATSGAASGMKKMADTARQMSTELGVVIRDFSVFQEQGLSDNPFQSMVPSAKEIQNALNSEIMQMERIRDLNDDIAKNAKAHYSGPVPPLLSSAGPNAGQASKGGMHGTNITGIVSNFFNKSLTGPQAALAKFAGVLAAIRVALGLAGFAASLFLKPLKELMRVFLDAAEQARRLYASALQSGGLPIGFVAKRNALAEVLGVGQDDVWQYAQAIRMLNNDLKYSTRAISETNPTLTAMGWEWQILKKDMQALGAMIAYDLTPWIHVLFNALHAGFTDLILMAKLFQKTAEFRVLSWLLKQFGEGAPTAPPPVASAKRLASSVWERQGLVLGFGASDSPAMQTARNTSSMAKDSAKTVQVLGTISTALSRVNVYAKVVGALIP